MEANKQGIGSILGSDCESIKSPLRRTLSADMSSKKWQSQHSLKKVSSYVSIAHCSSSSSLAEEEPPGQSEIWSSIQEEKSKKELENPGQLDIWSSILSQRQKEAEDSTTQPIPYVHPLVRRSTSSLSEKSLQICTESLGSETGSDGFSSYPPSESSDVEDKKEAEEESQQQEEEKPYEMEAWRAVKYNNTASKKPSPKSFPPLLPSLSRGNGASLQMRPRRDNGRLVLEAVSIPSQNNFLAQRGDGRLVLTLANTCNQQDQQMNGNGVFEFEIDSCHEEEEEGTEMETEEEERESEDAKFVKEEAPKLCGGVINFHRVALMMNKPGLSLSNENSKWIDKYNEIGQVEEAGKPRTSVTQSLPPRPPVVCRMIPAAKITASASASASALNAYEHYWKARPMSLTKDNKGDYLVPVSKGCKDRRRSLLLWEPYCIATS